jgi:murein DD-endopeptidase MepM/ murein hydrolase activator NlpD
MVFIQLIGRFGLPADCAEGMRLLSSKVTSKRVKVTKSAIVNEDCKSSFDWLSTFRAGLLAKILAGRSIQGPGLDLTSKRFSLKKRFYIVLVSRDEAGGVRKVPIPLHYAYVFVAAAVIGAFTITGLAGSYTRMLVKTARFNQLRNDHDVLQKDYAHLEKQEHEKDVQAASLGSLATEVSALYGLTSRLSLPGHSRVKALDKAAGAKVTDAPLASETASNFTDESYYRSLDTFRNLRTSALSGAATQAIVSIQGLGPLSGAGSDGGFAIDAPNLWPVMGPITSSFGQREDPVLHNGEGEFHSGLDISAPVGTPVRATGDGTVKFAGMANGYGREVILDHGHNLETCYAHMSGFAVMEGQSVVRGQVIGYVGMSGRITGANLHYEVRIRNIPVNPHKYLRETLAGMGSVPTATKAGS